jgi:fructose-1,6-bisphosphatase/inositol monophosphatase family enzyme
VLHGVRALRRVLGDVALAWDIAAGADSSSARGGRVVRTFLGRDGYLKTGNVVTANKRLHHAMLDVIRQTMV